MLGEGLFIGADDSWCELKYRMRDFARANDSWSELKYMTRDYLSGQMINGMPLLACI